MQTPAPSYLLAHHGNVAKGGAGRSALTPSEHDKNAAIAVRSAAFAAEKLQGLPEADVDAAKRVLLALNDC